MKRKYFFVISFLVLAIFLVGCSGGIVTPITDTDEVVVQEVLSIHDLAEQKLDDIAEEPNINNIEDILKNLDQYIKEQTGIDSVILNDNSLQINYESGVVSFIVLHDTSAEPFLGDIGRNSTSSILFNKQTRKKEELVFKLVISDFKLKADENIEYIDNHNILIWAPMESIASNNILGYGNYGIISGLEERFAESNLNFTVNSLADEDADIDSLQTITDYGMVFLFSHGADSGWLETGEVVKDSNAYKTEIENKSIAITQHYWININTNWLNFDIVKKGKPIYRVNVNWFNDHLSNKFFPNTIIVNLSCESFNLPLYLCNTFIGRNAGAYYGFEGKVGAKFAQQRAYELAENLRDGDKTTGEAYKPSTDWFYGGAWKMTGKENLKFSKDTVNTAAGSVHNLTKGTYYDTIQGALDDADNDNTIEVADGTYDESITFPFIKKIILRSINGASSTIIRGDDGSATVISESPEEGTILEGFTITHASGNRGKGIYIDGNLNIKNCNISDNSSSCGVYIYYGSITISGSTISGNTYSGIFNNKSSITITGSTISGNVSGIFNDEGSITISGSTISGNTTPGLGGGIRNLSGSITITGSTISDNSADDGGGVSNEISEYGGGGSTTITGSTISGNTASGLGGGIYGYYSVITITGSTISGNAAYEGGGGIFVERGLMTIGGSSDAEKNTICGNYKSGYSPSMDQQIRDKDDGDLYETYKDTNYISAYCE